MATSRIQRGIIWVIAAALMGGTIMGFLVMILSSQTQQQQQAAWQKYQAEYAAYQKKTTAQAAELSNRYFAEFQPYSANVATFDAASATAMAQSDLKVGDGEAITDTTKFAAYYIGWTPDGKVFDQSIDGSSLKAPISINELKNTSLIAGWKEGMLGMKIGGVRELTIPADKAYGKQGSTDATGKQTIAPDTPLKFVVMAIPQPTAIPQPAMSPEVQQYIQAQYGGQQ